MHCLEVIVERNERAAGREFSLAVADGDVKRAKQILDNGPHPGRVTGAFYSAARAAESEG